MVSARVKFQQLAEHVTGLDSLSSNAGKARLHEWSTKATAKLVGCDFSPGMPEQRVPAYADADADLILFSLGLKHVRLAAFCTLAEGPR
jgi:hypothetical protein